MNIKFIYNYKVKMARSWGPRSCRLTWWKNGLTEPQDGGNLEEVHFLYLFMILSRLLLIKFMQVETWPCSHLDTQLPNIPLELNSRPGAAYLGIGLGMD
jgi:hypothetical protein